MYFHGLEKFAEQFSRVVTSLDAIHFTALPDIIGGTANPGMGKTYLRSSR